jgi:uncharacterized Zn finger protein
VAGSELYKIKIGIAPVKPSRWKSICRDCAGSIDSVVELLHGRLAKGVMDRVCREGDGLFPSPDEIKLSCSCPDWADMCKHVAAALYGVGARLDEKPQLLFLLRGVDENELFAGAGEGMSLSKAAPSAANVLDDGDVAALFGLEMADAVASKAPDGPRRAAKESKSAMAAEKKTKIKVKSATASLRATPGKADIRVNAPARRQASRATKRDHPVS